jgi:hypothetical protein
MIILKTTIAKKVTISGGMARFNESARCLLQNFDSENISDTPRSTIRHITAATLTSVSPIVVNALIVGAELVNDVTIADVVLIIDISI